MNTNRVLIIAEAGVNHNGDIALAKKLVDEAANAGVDIVKFQTFKAESLVSKEAKQAEYQQKNIGSSDSTQYQMLKKLELSEEQHHELQEYCTKKNIQFLSTAFDESSIDFLFDLGVRIFKIPSGEITNLPYLKKIGKLKLPVIISTGMCFMSEIKDAVKVLVDCGVSREKIIVLHCNTEYPTPMKDVNLTAMLSIQKELGTEIGYSDHTLGIEVPIAAVALGAKVIEKHFTLDRNMQGPDHKASLEPNELKQMVIAIRNIEAAMGSGIKEPSESEKKNIAIARKSIHLANSLTKNHIIKVSDLVMKRPGNGISPMMMEKIIGKTVAKDLAADTLLTWEDLI